MLDAQTQRPLTDRLVCTVMAGGSGTRFWPLSRKQTPKQLLKFFGDSTLLQATFERVAPLCPPERRAVVTAWHLVDGVRETLPEIPAAQIIGEPSARNTAPCMALAALVAQKLVPDAILVLLPADHWVADAAAFQKALLQAAMHADHGHIVTLGVTPTHPETGYGYIELGEQAEPGVNDVARFVEKPSLDVAMHYLEGRRHLWNAGVFVLRADRALQAIGQHIPEIMVHLDGLQHHDVGDAAWLQALQAGFDRCPSVSIDYGVMEHEHGIRVVKLSAGWSDVGTWHSLLDLRDPAEKNGNFARGEVVAVDTGNCVLISQGPLVATVGLQDIAVVATPDATLVLPLSRSQDVRRVVAELQARGRTDVL